MKLTIRVDWGGPPPKFYGLAYVDHCERRGVYAIFPLNWIIAIANYIYLEALRSRLSDAELEQRDAKCYQSGYDRGIQDGERRVWKKLFYGERR